jgi:enoyl-CoA hydratase/carnithine racemase
MVLKYETDGHVCTITLDREKALNSFSRELIAAFADACAKFDADDELWVGIVTGSGDRSFSAGADLKDTIPALMDDPAKGGYVVPPNIMRGQYVSKPLIAAVNGMALGGGMELALACDLRVASTKATFGQPEVGLGIIPGWGGTQRLPRLLPGAIAMELLLTGEAIDAETALRVGLVNAVVEPEELMTKAREYADRICANGPLAVRAAKEAAVRGIQTSLDDGLRIEKLLFDRLAYTDDLREGLAAFLERRPASFKGG